MSLQWRQEQAAPGSREKGDRQGVSHIQLCSPSLCSKHNWLQTPDMQGVRGMGREGLSPGVWAEEQVCPGWRRGP